MCCFDLHLQPMKLTCGAVVIVALFEMIAREWGWQVFYILLRHGHQFYASHGHLIADGREICGLTGM
jgi:hypothetical protein